MERVEKRARPGKHRCSRAIAGQHPRGDRASCRHCRATPRRSRPSCGGLPLDGERAFAAAARRGRRIAARLATALGSVRAASSGCPARPRASSASCRATRRAVAARRLGRRRAAAAAARGARHAAPRCARSRDSCARTRRPAARAAGDGRGASANERMIVLLAAAAMCAGCVGSALESKREEPEVFRLHDAARPRTPAPRCRRALAVGRPRAPVSLDTERIAVAGPATPLRLLLRRALGGAGAADAAASPGRGAHGRWPVRDRGLRRRPGAERSSCSRSSCDASRRRAPLTRARRCVQVQMQVTLRRRRGAVRGSRVSRRRRSVAAEADRRADVIAAFDAATRR